MAASDSPTAIFTGASFTGHRTTRIIITHIAAGWSGPTTARAGSAITGGGTVTTGVIGGIDELASQ
jgi:hypothetical protein